MGIIYVCESVTTSGIIKIGIADADNEENMLERFRAHNLNGYRGQKFKPYVAIKNQKYKQFEQVFKKIFSKSRISDTELYVISKEDIVDFLALIAEKIVYGQEAFASAEAAGEESERSDNPPGIRTRAPKIRRSALGIRYGAKLWYCQRNGVLVLDGHGRKIAVKNIDDDVVEYDGNTDTITAMAKKLRGTPLHVRFSANAPSPEVLRVQMRRWDKVPIGVHRQAEAAPKGRPAYGYFLE